MERVVHRFRTKTFLVRASTAPPRDAAFVDKQWMPIRLPPERSKPEVQRMVFTKTLSSSTTGGQPRNEPRESSNRKTETHQKEEAGQPTTFSVQSSFKGRIQKIMRDPCQVCTNWKRGLITWKKRVMNPWLSRLIRMMNQSSRLRCGRSAIIQKNDLSRSFREASVWFCWSPSWGSNQSRSALLNPFRERDKLSAARPFVAWQPLISTSRRCRKSG